MQSSGSRTASLGNCDCLRHDEDAETLDRYLADPRAAPI
jgi:hypothetical protein